MRGLRGRPLDLSDRGNEAAGQDDDLDGSVSGDAEGAVGVVFTRQVAMRKLYGRAEEQQQDAQQAGEASVASTEAAGS